MSNICRCRCQRLHAALKCPAQWEEQGKAALYTNVIYTYFVYIFEGVSECLTLLQVVDNFWVFLLVSDCVFATLCRSSAARICTYFAYSTRLAALSTFNSVSRTQTRTHPNWQTRTHTGCEVFVTFGVLKFATFAGTRTYQKCFDFGRSAVKVNADLWTPDHAHCPFAHTQTQHSRAVNKFSN